MHREAVQIVKKLKTAGFIAYYAGGWVRDYLLKHPSDDIDIATNATPKEIQEIFPRTIPVGSQFGIIIVQIGKKQYEVATFRRDFEYQDGRRPSKIEFTDAIEDAKRRDFTINGMFYDPLEDKVHDFVKGKEDLKKRVIRAIGDAHLRISEDRLRMIRAVRLSLRFGFQIEKKTALAIKAHAKELFPAVAIERICQELKKMANFGTLKGCLIKMHQFHLLETIFPELQNLSLEELRKRLKPLDYYPKQSPLLTELLCLFPSLSEEKILILAQYLKLSNTERDFGLFLVKAEQQLLNSPTDAILVNLYADPKWKILSKVLQARCPIKKQEAFASFHGKKRKSLSHWVNRKIDDNPVISSLTLKEAGISPGKTMGLLLKEAEKVAIEKRLKHPNQVLNLLQKSPLWPTS